VPRPFIGPGLAKVHKLQAVTHRTVPLVAVREGWFVSALDEADVVSEGSVVQEPDGAAYYGTTSVHCSVAAEAAASDEASAVAPGELAAVLLADPHARLRLLRLAHREAAVRASGPLGVLHAEMSGEVLNRCGELTIAIVVDVSAALQQLRRDAM